MTEQAATRIESPRYIMKRSSDGSWRHLAARRTDADPFILLPANTVPSPATCATLPKRIGLKSWLERNMQYGVGRYTWVQFGDSMSVHARYEPKYFVNDAEVEPSELAPPSDGESEHADFVAGDAENGTVSDEVDGNGSAPPAAAPPAPPAPVAPEFGDVDEFAPPSDGSISFDMGDAEEIPVLVDSEGE